MSDINSGVSSRAADELHGTNVRVVDLNLPEDEGEGLGFRLTRTLWDPYPWVREVTKDSRADSAGLKTGDCLLQADGRDLLGLPIGQVAGLIRGDGAGRSVSLLVWNCGVDPKEDPELLWSCGGGSSGERSRRALGDVLRAIACCVCAATATNPLNCKRSHLYCEPCWSRLDRCALCREGLPPKESPYARNLVAEQVFEAIAKEYEIKNAIRRTTGTASAYTSPTRSPNMSPGPQRRGQYQLSMMNRKRVQFSQNYASDPNIHRSLHTQEFQRQLSVDNNRRQQNKPPKCSCSDLSKAEQNIDNSESINDSNKNMSNSNMSSACQNLFVQHKLVTRLRHVCSLVDLQNAQQTRSLSQSLNNVNSHECDSKGHARSLENLKTSCGSGCGSPVFVLPSPPVYVLACEHGK